MTVLPAVRGSVSPSIAGKARKTARATNATRNGSSAIGAFIFGMTTEGIVYAGWDPNRFKAFLGVMLLLAVLVNLYFKKLSSTRK